MPAPANASMPVGAWQTPKAATYAVPDQPEAVETFNFTAIAAGYAHTCALLSSGGVKCWGNNWAGQLGDGTLTDRSTPVDVVGLSSGVTAIAVGFYHTCGLVLGGGAKCWGNNWAGQLDDGTLTQRSIPVDVAGLASGVTAIAVGFDHTCALLSSGGAKCWGDNSNGQLGDGTLTQRSIPVDVAGLASGVTAIASGGGPWSGGGYTCALVGAGRPKCWGSDNYGQLGVGTTRQRLTPVDVAGPSLTTNYPNGQPGSFFTITGWNFPPGAQATLSINGQVISTTLGVNPTGSFIFFLTPAALRRVVTRSRSAGTQAPQPAFALPMKHPYDPRKAAGRCLSFQMGLHSTISYIYRCR